MTHYNEHRPHQEAGAARKSCDGDTTTVPASAPTVTVTPWAQALAASTVVPTCACGDWCRALAVAVPLVWADAYDHGRRAGALEGPAHPAVVDSVNRMFAGWDGADAAAARSVARFHDWHQGARRQGVAA